MQRGTEGWADLQNTQGRRLEPALTPEAERWGVEPRSLADEDSSDGWQWDEPKVQSVDQFHGAHFDLDDARYEALMSWRTSLVPEDAECADYFDRIEPPMGGWDSNSPPAGALAAYRPDVPVLAPLPQYAPLPEIVRAPPPPCKFWSAPGGCRNGSACRFAHPVAGRAPSYAPPPQYAPMPPAPDRGVGAGEDRKRAGGAGGADGRRVPGAEPLERVR